MSSWEQIEEMLKNTTPVEPAVEEVLEDVVEALLPAVPHDIIIEVVEEAVS